MFLFKLVRSSVLQLHGASDYRLQILKYYCLFFRIFLKEKQPVAQINAHYSELLVCNLAV